mmetsp:Transcript_14710/g.27675  ORF Transcript_14710/g.27675 Transcript_14710/m.27675 type:complete len:205 (-) Transcript_14710:1362-1976(-)
MITQRVYFLLCILVSCCWKVHPSNAFIVVNKFVAPINTLRSEKESRSQLRLFGGLFGKKLQPENKDPSIPTRIFDIPCSNVKLGSCRFALGLFLIGQQGTPVKGTWKANQANDGVLDMFYLDNTGMFSVVLTERSISVDRYGLQPSLQYRLQESLVLHRLLDEIKTLALEGDDIKDENRLIVLSDPDVVIQQAREKLPARAADE